MMLIHHTGLVILALSGVLCQTTQLVSTPKPVTIAVPAVTTVNKTSPTNTTVQPTSQVVTNNPKATTTIGKNTSQVATNNLTTPTPTVAKITSSVATNNQTTPTPTMAKITTSVETNNQTTATPTMGNKTSPVVSNNLTATTTMAKNTSQVVTNNQTTATTTMAKNTSPVVTNNQTTATPTTGNNTSPVVTKKSTATTTMAKNTSPVVTNNHTTATPTTGNNTSPVVTNNSIATTTMAKNTSPVVTNNHTTTTPTTGKNTSPVVTNNQTTAITTIPKNTSPVVTNNHTTATPTTGNNTSPVVTNNSTAATTMAKNTSPVVTNNHTTATPTTGNNTSPVVTNNSTAATTIAKNTSPVVTNNQTTATPTMAKKTSPVVTTKQPSSVTPPTTTNQASAVPPTGPQVIYINEIMVDKNGGFQKVELHMPDPFDVTRYAMVMVDGGTNKTMSIVYLKNVVAQGEKGLMLVTFDAKDNSPIMKSQGIGIAVYNMDKMEREFQSDWTVSTPGLVDALVIGKSYEEISEHLIQTLTPGMNPFVLDPSLYGKERTISRCSSDLTRSTDMYALIDPSLGIDNKDRCDERLVYKNKLALKFSADCGLFKYSNHSINKVAMKKLMRFIVKEVNRKCQCGITRMHLLLPTITCCGGTNLDMVFVAPYQKQADTFLNSYKTFVQQTTQLPMEGHVYKLDTGCYSDCCRTPVPQKQDDGAKNVKVTVAVIVSCLIVFMVIVILVIMYMRRKKSAVYQFRMSRLDEEDDLYTDGTDRDEFVGGQEATFDLKR